jgi:hypothetical protein
MYGEPILRRGVLTFAQVKDEIALRLWRAVEAWQGSLAGEVARGKGSIEWTAACNAVAVFKQMGRYDDGEKKREELCV